MTKEKLTDKEVANSKSEKIMNAVAWYCGYYRKNPQRFAKEYLNLNLKLFQQILLYLMVRSTGFCFIAARGLGKSFLTAVFIVIKCLLWPGTKCIIACKVRTQSINILDEKIMKELVPNSPLLQSEIKKVDINNQKAEIIFKNGSYVKVVTATDSARGARANLILVDEYRMMDEDIINMVLKKFLNIVRHPGYLDKPEYKHMAERNQEFYLSSAWFQNHWSYEKCKDYFVNMIDRSKKYYCCAFDYRMSIKEGLLLKEAVEDEMSESSFSDLKFSMEMLTEWIGSIEGGLFQFDDINKTRVIEKAYYAPNIVLSPTATDVPKKKNGEIRILTADIALMSSKKNDNDATSIFLNCMIPNKSGRYTSNFVYSENVEGMSVQDQALKLRRYFEYFNCDYLGIDARSVGIPLIDLLMRDIYDPETGETYPAISCCNNTEIADRCSDKAAKKVIWAIMGSAQFNSDVAIGLRSGFQQGRIHLLQSEYSCEDQLRKLYKGYDKMSPSERAALQMPYINTGLAVNELVNLGYETVNNVIRVKEKSGCRKDRYSSLSYNYYIAQQVERSMEKRHNKPKLLDFNFRAPVLKKGGL